jgi:hypothetical protein
MALRATLAHAGRGRLTQGAHDACAAFGGIDWAAIPHDGCLQAAGAAQRAGFPLAPRPEAIDAWGTTLRTRGNGHLVALCRARTKGPLVFALRKDDVLVLVPSKPLMLAR